MSYKETYGKLRHVLCTLHTDRSLLFDTCQGHRLFSCAPILVTEYSLDSLYLLFCLVVFQVGGKRCFDLKTKECILSQLGSGPDSTTSGTGHYSVNEYKEILRYAKERHIQVIPEFDMPGHGNAAIKAMLARYDKLSTHGDKQGAGKYLLSEANDTSRYLSVQHYSDDAINPCIESTYAFIQHLVESVVNMHSAIQPLTVFHFGGDEVAHGAWINSTARGNLVQRLGLGNSGGKIADELKGYFVQRVANITSNYSLELASWEDGLMDVNNVPYGRNSMSNTQVYGYAWNNIWEWGDGKRAYELANAGYKVHILSLFFLCCSALKNDYATLACT